MHNFLVADIRLTSNTLLRAGQRKEQFLGNQNQYSSSPFGGRSSSIEVAVIHKTSELRFSLSLSYTHTHTHTHTAIIVIQVRDFVTGEVGEYLDGEGGGFSA